MPSDKRRSIDVEDGEKNLLHAVWSRSGKRLIVSVARGGRWDGAGQIELEPDQVETFCRFLSETLVQASGDR